MKAVIPVAGLGTRLLPATKVIPKEMLPIVDKPIIQYIVEEIAHAGITEIILVTHSSKNPIENHFDVHFELETTLEKRLKRSLLETLQQITPNNVKIIQIRQGQALGLGHAILAAYPVVGDHDVMVVLPDMLLENEGHAGTNTNLKKMYEAYQASGESQILVHPVPKKDVVKFGVVDFVDKETHFTAGDQASVKALVEKPTVDEAPSHFAITGRYILSRSIWTFLQQTPIGTQDEVQLTDALALMLKEGHALNAHHLKGIMYDCGQKLGYMQANMAYALHHPEIGRDMRQFVDACQADEKVSA